MIDQDTAYVLRKVLQQCWGDNPCEHPKTLPVGVDATSGPFEWICLKCGRSLTSDVVTSGPRIEIHMKNSDQNQANPQAELSDSVKE